MRTPATEMVHTSARTNAMIFFMCWLLLRSELIARIANIVKIVAENVIDAHSATAVRLHKAIVRPASPAYDPPLQTRRTTTSTVLC